MSLEKSLVSYWLHSICYEWFIEQTYQLEPLGLSIEEAETGRLGDSTLQVIRKECGFNQPMVAVSPLWAEGPSSALYHQVHPVILIATMNESGNLSPHPLFPLPIIPKRYLDPFGEHSVTLLSAEAVNQYVQLNAYALSEDEQPSWGELYQFALEMTESMTDKPLQEYLRLSGYLCLDKCAIFPLKPLKKLPDPSLFHSYEQLLNPGTNERSAFIHRVMEESPACQSVMAKTDFPRLESQYLGHISSNFALSIEQKQVVAQTLALEPSEVFAVEALSGSGQATCISNIVVTDWIQCAIEQKLPPIQKYIDGQKERLVNIFDLPFNRGAPEPQSWLADPKGYVITAHQLVDNFNQCGGHQVVHQFLSRCKAALGRVVTDLSMAKEVLRQGLNDYSKHLKQGIHLHQDYWKLNQQLFLQYQPHGSIQNRLVQLESEFHKHSAELKHLLMVQSLWYQQVELVLPWKTLLTLIPWLYQKKVNKLKDFIKEHLPRESFDYLTIEDISVKIQDLINRTKQKERAKGDALHQVKLDYEQLQMALAACKAWTADVANQNYEPESFGAILDMSLRYELYVFALHYWEACLLLALKDNQTAWYEDYFIRDEQVSAHFYDSLFVTNAQYITPAMGVHWLLSAKKATVFGYHYPAKDNPIISSTLDYGWMQYYGLVEFDDDYENFQYRGVTNAEGDLFQLARHVSNYKIIEDEFCDIYYAFALKKVWRQHPVIQRLSCELMSGSLNEEKPQRVTIGYQPPFCSISVQGKTEPAFGSFKNRKEASQITHWLKRNERALCQFYDSTHLSDIVAIVTPFSGQQGYIKGLFKAQNIDIDTILTLPECCLSSIKQYPLVIVSLVQTYDHELPLMVDKGPELWHKWLSMSSDSVLIFGDRNIFDTKVNTPTAKLAKEILKSPANLLVNFGWIPEKEDRQQSLISELNDV